MSGGKGHLPIYPKATGTISGRKELTYIINVRTYDKPPSEKNYPDAPPRNNGGGGSGGGSPR